MDDVEHRLTVLQNNQRAADAQVVVSVDTEQIDVPDMLDQLFGDLDMLRVDDEDHHVIEALSHINTELELLRAKDKALDPKIVALTKNLSNLSMDLEFDRRSVILSMKQRGYAYSLDRSRGAQNRRLHKELIAKFYYLQMNFVGLLQYSDTVTARARSVLGNLGTLLKGHKILLHQLDRCDEMGGSLLIGGLLQSHLMPVLMEYRKYARNFQDTSKTLRTLMCDPETRAALDMYQTQKWGGVDLDAILWLPIDHLHCTATVLSELVEANQQDIQLRALDQAAVKAGRAQVAHGPANPLSDVQNNLAQLERVRNAVVDTCNNMAGTDTVGRTMTSVSGLQDELCGDFSNFVVPGRREVLRGKLRRVLSGHTLDVNAYLFHDVLLTATDGASGFRVFSSKTALYNATVGYTSLSNVFNIVERDAVTGLVVGTHVFEAPTEKSAVEWISKIQITSSMLTQLWQTQSEDAPVNCPNTGLCKQAEDLRHAQVRLKRECKMLKEDEDRFDKLLEQSLQGFNSLRVKQWDIDFQRVQVGLKVDARTRVEFEIPPSSVQLEDQTADSVLTEPQVTAVTEILDSLVPKLNALEDMLTGFALQPFKPDQMQIPLEEVAVLLTGKWRMYRKPYDQPAFSYGLIIKHVKADHRDPHSFFWSGSGTVQGYKTQNATAVWDPDTSKVKLTFTEVWHANGTKANVSAQLNLNGKFACESLTGSHLKARKECTNSHPRFVKCIADEKPLNNHPPTDAKSTTLVDTLPEEESQIKEDNLSGDPFWHGLLQRHDTTKCYSFDQGPPLSRRTGSEDGTTRQRFLESPADHQSRFHWSPIIV
eukprot:TRINITY_DN1844_c0_g1_i1.p1 TRINITY_DN1844_c0_g1~~TRINITY_DN1844_c0_g1_i1.p1  ORF type:complete len:822 (-),score=171.30 TRINITY_DN1844_c0_g1_i1:353-2818(-)